MLFILLHPAVWPSSPVAATARQPCERNYDLGGSDSLWLHGLPTLAITIGQCLGWYDHFDGIVQKHIHKRLI